MPGGSRPNSGRPKGSGKNRHKVVVEDPTELMPVEWMLAVLRDPEADQSRRDRMAEIAAPYLHPQLIHTYQELSETEPWQEVEHVRRRAPEGKRCGVSTPAGHC